MDLSLTEDQRFIQDEARRLLADKASPERVRAVFEAGMGHDADLWGSIAAELGWCAMAIPEEYDGLGLGDTELVLLLESLGERLAPVPFWSTACVATPLLMAVGSDAARAAYLPRIAVGELTATVAWGQLDAADPLSSVTVTASRTGDGYALDGRVAKVVDLGAADLVLVPAQLEGSSALFALSRDVLQARRLETLDRTRSFGELILESVEVAEEVRIDGGTGLAPEAIAAAVATAQITLAAEEVGAARGVMDLTLAYVAERVQFGRTIASFQAIKHRCARLEIDLAEARALVHGAAANAAQTDTYERLREACGARALASDLLFRAAEESIQLHGGVGFTWEYDPHLYLRRAQACQSLLGSPDRHLSAIADDLLGKVVAI